MLEEFGIMASVNLFVYIMISFAFFIGIMLTVSQEAFEHFNAALTKEYGYKKKIMPNLEGRHNNFIDWLLLKYRLFSGLLIAVTSFMLLLFYKV